MTTLTYNNIQTLGHNIVYITMTRKIWKLVLSFVLKKPQQQLINNSDNKFFIA